MKRFLVLVLVVSVLSMNILSVSAAENTDAKKTAVAPKATVTVDGNLDSAWEGVSANVIMTETTGGDVPKASNYSGSFKTLWDDTNLYVAFDIKDDKVLKVDEAPELTQSDTVEIYLNPSNVSGNTLKIGKIIQIRTVDQKISLVGGTNEDLLQIKAASKLNATGYTMEIALPWSILGIKAANDVSFGLDAFVDDNDNGGNSRQAQYSWNSFDDNAWQNTDRFGILKLSNSPLSKLAIAKRLKNNITLDGKLDNIWSGVQLNKIQTETTGGDVPTAKNYTGAFKTLWDDTNLYVAFDIKDDKVLKVDEAPELTQSDTVEIYLNPNNVSGNTLKVGKIIQIRTVDQKISLVGGTNEDLLEIKAASKLNATGYTMEIVLPWSILGIKPANDVSFGLDAFVDDNDNGGNSRQAQYSWNSFDDNAWQNTDRFGIIKLSNVEAAVKEVVAKEISIKVAGKIVKFSEKPVFSGSTVMASADVLSKAIGAKYVYSSKNKTATITKGKNKIVFTVGAKSAKVNNKVVKLDAQTSLVKSLRIPVKFLAEKLGYKYSYNANTNEVLIK